MSFKTVITEEKINQAFKDTNIGRQEITDALADWLDKYIQENTETLSVYEVATMVEDIKRLVIKRVLDKISN